MGTSRLDGISRVLAGGLSRRQALRQLGVIFVAGGAALVEPEIATAAPAGKCAKGTTQCCVCVSTSIDPHNCGACGHVCSLANASAVCTNGTCQVGACNAGFGNCNNIAADGCEVNLNTDPNNCGTCGHACGSGQTCLAGTCTGASGLGATCTSASQCSSGFCVSSNNGIGSVCCAAACTATPPSSCGFNGDCGPTGTCSLWPNMTTCSSASCNGTVFTPAGTCDGVGHCVSSAPTTCSGATPICNAAAGRCVQCNLDSDCTSGQTCSNHVCV